MNKKIAVIGSGAWGTALAQVASDNFSQVLLLSRNRQVIDDINNNRENKLYLPAVKLNANIYAVDNWNEVIGADIILAVVPAQHFRSICENLREVGADKANLVICCKGVEQNSLLLMSDVAMELLPGNEISILSGPNFANEVACGKPAAAVIAARNIDIASAIAASLSNKCFRIYSTDDVVSAQICGAVKNVLAIACGMVIGKDLGENAKASLITRGISEIKRLCVAKNGKIETVLGLSGVGDIFLTCGSVKSRNTSLGVEIAQGKTLQQIMDSRITVAEGMHSVKAIVALAQRYNVDMPICTMVNNVLYHGITVDEAMKILTSRPLARE